MRGNGVGFVERAQALREAFDRSFSDVRRVETEATVDLLMIRVGADAYALRLVEVAGLFVDRAVTPLPTLVPELLGIAGFRATLVPVYDLRLLLGYSTGEAPRWMASTAGQPTVGLAFDRFEQHVRVPRAALAPDDSLARRHIGQVARTVDGARPVVDISSVLGAVKVRALRGASSKEP
jgi:chemotaxis signal transduction protein